MSTLTDVRPAPAIARTYQWAVSDGEYENLSIASTSWAAAWLVDVAMRKHRQGLTPQLTVHLQDRLLAVLWDATSDVMDILKATALELHPAIWRPGGVYNKRAGYDRNEAMVDTGPDHLIAFILDSSGGASHCLRYAKSKGIPVSVHEASSGATAEG